VDSDAFISEKRSDADAEKIIFAAVPVPLLLRRIIGFRTSGIKMGSPVQVRRYPRSCKLDACMGF
jgi:hypothetical protein